jgi:hypothetical protein
MQRGALKRDRAPASKEPDYAKVAPQLRDEDRVHLGLTEAATEKLKHMLTEKIRGYARAGFRKPADVARLLNKEAIRTAAGSEWNPRLVYFLLQRIFADSPRPARQPQPTQPTSKLQDQNKFDQVREKLRKKRPIETPAAPKEVIVIRKEKPAKRIKVRAPSPPVPLSEVEMAARLKALQDHFNA